MGGECVLLMLVIVYRLLFFRSMSKYALEVQYILQTDVPLHMKAEG